MSLLVRIPRRCRSGGARLQFPGTACWPAVQPATKKVIANGADYLPHDAPDNRYCALADEHGEASTAGVPDEFPCGRPSDVQSRQRETRIVNRREMRWLRTGPEH